jgi:hypothetical protein
MSGVWLSISGAVVCVAYVCVAPVLWPLAAVSCLFAGFAIGITVQAERSH